MYPNDARTAREPIWNADESVRLCEGHPKARPLARPDGIWRSTPIMTLLIDGFLMDFARLCGGACTDDDPRAGFRQHYLLTEWGVVLRTRRRGPSEKMRLHALEPPARAVRRLAAYSEWLYSTA